MLFLLIAIGLIDWQRSGFLIFVWTIWGGYFGVIVNALRTRTGWEMNLGQQITVLVLWTGFFLLLCNDWVWQKVQKPQTMTYFFNVFSLVLISSSVYRILAYRYGQIDVGKYSSEFGELRDLRIKEKPDIYYIVLDGYGRADVLKDIYALDIDAF